ncbi:MAG: hypothetical protein ACOH2F_03760 [Cellulomonas sp.]
MSHSATTATTVILQNPDMQPEADLLDLVADAILATRRATARTDNRAAAEWETVEAWAEALTSLWHTALDAVPEDLHHLL